MHSEEVSSEGSLAESLSCAKECGRRPQAILVAEPLKVIKPLQHPGRSGISHHPSRYVIECQRIRTAATLVAADSMASRAKQLERSL
jgi:hypothetical protein